MGGGRSLYSGEQAESDSEGEDDDGFPEERSQQKRRGCNPSTDLRGRSGSPHDMDWREPDGLKGAAPVGELPVVQPTGQHQCREGSTVPQGAGEPERLHGKGCGDCQGKSE